MSRLELKVPPALLMLMIAFIMWVISHVLPGFIVSNKTVYFVQLVFVVTGILLVSMGITTFRKAGTTFNPMKPDEASLLVTTGVYKVTRNPMYLGILFLLFAWGLFLLNIFSCVVSMLFVLYMNNYQIKPEERALEQMFGQEFINYKSRVHRWL